jgi:hypothetical protein
VESSQLGDATVAPFCERLPSYTQVDSDVPEECLIRKKLFVLWYPFPKLNIDPDPFGLGLYHSQTVRSLVGMVMVGRARYCS